VHRGGNIKEVKENNLSKSKRQEVTKLYMTFHKAIPLHAHSGPEGFRKLRLPDFKKIGT
jgi:hypothetical protein